MARLILEESGNTRRFKLSPGKLTFGSGEKATLTLASEDVAALHGQIEMGEDGAVLRVAKGVMPPKVAGRTVQGAHVMREGEVVTIGSSQFRVEYDEGEGPAGAAAPSPVTRPSGRSGASSGSARRGSRSGSRGGGSSRGRRSGGASDEDGERPRPSRKSTGMPGWLIGLLVLIGIVGLGYLVIGQTASTMGDVFDFDVRFSQYQRIKDEDPGSARSDLAKIEQEDLTPAQKELVRNEFLILDDRLASLDDSARNSEISTYLKMRILDYFESRPVTEDRSYARLFLKRANDFVSGYPTHPEVEKVKRLIRRATPVAKLEEPAIYKDLEVEVTGFTGAKPMDFPTAYASIDKFIKETSDADEIAKAEQLRAETQQAELELYEAQLDNAAIVYDKFKYPDKYNPSTAMQDMVIIITSVQNQEYKDDAARRITQIKEMDQSYLRGYKRQRPDAWAKMMQVPILREFAQANGVEE